MKAQSDAIDLKSYFPHFNHENSLNVLYSSFYLIIYVAEYRIIDILVLEIDIFYVQFWIKFCFL